MYKQIRMKLSGTFNFIFLHKNSKLDLDCNLVKPQNGKREELELQTQISDISLTLHFTGSNFTYFSQGGGEMLLGRCFWWIPPPPRKCFQVDVFGKIQFVIQRIDKSWVKRSAKDITFKGCSKKKLKKILCKLLKIFLNIKFDSAKNSCFHLFQKANLPFKKDKNRRFLLNQALIQRVH